MNRKAISGIFCFALTVIFSLSASAAEPACEPVLGTIESSFTTDGCPSLCTAGTLTAGPLTGSTFFVVTSTERRAGVLFFCGLFTVTTGTGTATYETCGTLNDANGRYEGWFKLVSATGSLEGAASRLFSSGTSTGTGFRGTFEGVLCSN